MTTLGKALTVNQDTESKLSPAVTRYLDQVEEVLVELRVNDTIDALVALPDRIAKAQSELGSARSRVEMAKRNPLASARERLEMATLAVSMNAVLDGKNAEARDRQLKAALAQDKEVRQAQEDVYRAETDVLYLERDVAGAEEELNRLRDWFKAQLAVAGLLQAVIGATKVTL